MDIAIIIAVIVFVAFAGLLWRHEYQRNKAFEEYFQKCVKYGWRERTEAAVVTKDADV